jgi:hypothetical protein
MRRILDISALTLILFLAVSVFSQNNGPLAQKRVPQFTDYPSQVTQTRRSIRVDIGSTPYTSCFRTMLRETARNGVKFAGRYALSYWGCGSECAQIGIVDLRTGRSYVSPFWVTGVGVKTRPDSRLLIVNDPAEVAKRFGDDVATIPDGYQPEYYVWNGRKLLLIEGGKIGQEPQSEFRRCKERSPTLSKSLR